MRKTGVFQVVGVMAVAGVMGCGGGRLLPVTLPGQQPAPFSAAKSSTWMRADSLWELRDNPAMAREALKTYRKAVERQEEVPELLTRLARTCHLVATYVDTRPARAQKLYREGARAAEEALLAHPGFVHMLRESGDETEAVREVEGPYLESAFWYAANLGRLANLEGAKVRIGNREHLEGFIQRVAAVNDSVYFGGAHRFLGVMYLLLPQPAPDSARAHFDKALALSPLFFGTRTLMAEYLAVNEKDPTAFREQLEFVLNTPPDTLPGAAPENRYEQKRARELLKAERDLF